MRTTSGSWRVHKDFPNLPAWIVKTVGGTTTHWAGASLRFQEHEFKEAGTTYGHVPGANLLDWPITLAELEPYYAKAEDKMGVTRTNDIPACRATTISRSSRRGRQARLQGMSYRPHGDQQRAGDGRGRCMQLGFCFQGCKTGAKWSTLYTEIPTAEATGNLELRRSRMSRRSNTTPRAR